MDILFIRHATAQEAASGGDAKRKLTKAGVGEAKSLAKALKAMKIAPDKLLTSPLVRAVQTAAIVGEELGLEVQEAAFLAPGGGHADIRSQLDELATEGVESVALVGHAPLLDKMIGELIAPNAEIGLSVSKAGAALVEFDPRPGRGELLWLLRRKQVELMVS